MTSFMRVLALAGALFAASPELVHAGGAQRSEKTIVEIAVGAGSFKTLVAAVTAADLVATLSGPGPFTVFAPTDAAFSRLPNGTVEGLLKDIPTLTKVLTSHVLAGEKAPADLLKSGMVKALSGADLTIRFIDSVLLVNSSAVIAKPIRASNGIIYVIDTVL